MMNRTKLDRSGGLPEDLADLGVAYKAELDAAQKNLQAERSDLEWLLAHIHGKQVSCQQLPGLLKQAYSRLKKLRESQADLSGLATREPGIAALIEQADSALQSGDTFSLDDTDQAYEKACRRCLEICDEPENTALIRARQAQIAAAKQEYRRAAELYAESAATPGLEVTLQWQYQNKRASVLEDLGREFMDNAALEQAIDLYETTVLALAPKKERRDDWATTQNNLGNALGILGQRQRDTQMLKKSVAAYENALKEWTRERMPIGWAMTMANLGVARRTLAERAKDVDISRKAVADFEAAVDVFRNASHAHYTELGEEQLAKARALVKGLGRD